MVRDGLPDGFAEPPFGVVVAFVEGFGRIGIGELIVDDAVVRGVEAGGDGVVIGEGEGREDGNQAGKGFGAVRD